ncbi:hypothetical protein GF319_12320 [Candidatus Bathyarchaeota archaeon]|jgi:hypothetical protein|nr:hypothetical protein [Candidatus Bathyarchaeota archaeon]
MGRESIADKIFEKYKEREKGNRTWLILYDFNEVKPSTRFWDNLKRLQNKSEYSSLLQYSVFMTRDRRVAEAAADLVKYYDGEVLKFRGELIP